MIRLLAAMLAALFLSACGGGDALPVEAPPPMPQAMRAALEAAIPQQLATVAGGPLSAAEALDWAERNYPNLFPAAGKQSGFYSPYSYRYYPATDTYLGVATAVDDVAVYFYSRLNGWNMIRLGALADFTCTIKPASCVVGVSPASVAPQAYEGGAQQQLLLDVAVPPVPGALTAHVGTSPPASWLTTDIVGTSTLRITASAAGLAAGSYQGSVTVQFVPGVGPTTTKTVPVSFTVGHGLLAPADQQMTLDANTSAGPLVGSVAVARADGGAQAWTAASSQPWLHVTTASGTSPSTLSYSIDPTSTANLPNFADSTASVTISAAGVSPVSFQVTLNKRLPYLDAAMPYGIPAGSSARIVAHGKGFSQFAATPPLSGLQVSNVQVQSDTQMSFTATPASEGSYAVSIGNAAGIGTSAATLQATAPDGYSASSAAITDDHNNYALDPVRKAVFAVSYFGNALYRYQYTGGSWTIAAMAIQGPMALALSPDGSRLFATTLSGSLKEINPDTLAIIASYNMPSAPSGMYSSVMAFTVDGKLWLPGGYFGSMGYFDLATRTFATLPGATSIDTESFVVPANGSIALVSADHCCSPRNPWHLYKAADGSVTNPMGATDFWYDARLSTDGTRLMTQTDGAIYDAAYNLVGQLPAAASGEFWSRMALTPDGGSIAVLVDNGTYQSNIVRIDIFSTTALQPGTTRFKKTGSIPLSQQASDCNDGHYACEYAGRLIATQDNKALIWVGNRKLQVFKLP